MTHFLVRRGRDFKDKRFSVLLPNVTKKVKGGVEEATPEYQEERTLLV